MVKGVRLRARISKADQRVRNEVFDLCLKNQMLFLAFDTGSQALPSYVETSGQANINAS